MKTAFVLTTLLATTAAFGMFRMFHVTVIDWHVNERDGSLPSRNHYLATTGHYIP